MISDTSNISGQAAAHGAAEGLSLAAAPTFAIMALLAAVPGGGPLDGLCAAAQNASPVSGMVAMYMLMCAFHSGPWLKLISGRRRLDSAIAGPGGAGASSPVSIVKETTR